MKKLLILLITILFINLTSYAIEEVQLEKENLNFNKLSDIYYGNVENNESINPLIRLFTKKGLEFENSKINSVKIGFLYGGQMKLGFGSEQSTYFNHDFTVIEPMIIANFNENKTKAMFDINLTRKIKDYPNNFTEKISKLYISHNITPEQKILFGQGDRVPNTFNGSISYYNLDTVMKSQSGRTIGDYRSVGIRNIADYKYFDYDIGVYDSTRYMRDFGHGLDFTGKLVLKPFANLDNIGDLKIGGAYTVGEYANSYHQYAFYSAYDYKKFGIKAEYVNADGYNSIHYSNNNADGFYTTLSYDINDKFSLIGRYDYFVPNKAQTSSNSAEYTIGLTYKPYKNMKVLFNLVRTDYSYKDDSNMVLFATKFII